MTRLLHMMFLALFEVCLSQRRNGRDFVWVDKTGESLCWEQHVWERIFAHVGFIVY